MPKKPIDLKSYIKQMEKSIGKRDKVREVLDNDEYLNKYLISLGMNPEWTELPAVMEIIKSRLSKGLIEKQKNLRIREKKLFLGRGENKDGIQPNAISFNEFELGDNETLRYSPETDTIDYIKVKGKSNLEKREIDPKTGIVMRQLMRYGGKAADEKSDEYYSSIEYVRDREKPKITMKTIYKNANIEGKDISESEVSDYDYGYPIELEKNGTTHRKTPLYFIEKYPKYEEWFNGRFKSQDEYIRNMFDMQKSVMRDVWKQEQKKLQSSILDYARAKDELDIYYSGLQSSFETSIIGPVFRKYIINRIKSIIDNDELKLFYEVETQEEMKNKIMSNLEKRIEPKPIQEVVQESGEKVVDRIEANPDYQNAKELFTGDVKSVDDEDYSLQEALTTIDDQSNIVIDFKQEGNPFSKEKDRIEDRIAFLGKQIKILKTAYESFPRKKRSIRKIIKKEVDEKKLKKPDLPVNPTQSNEER